MRHPYLNRNKIKGAGKYESRNFWIGVVGTVVNVVMVIIVACYTYYAKGQLEEAKKSNELNKQIAYANFSSTAKSLEMTRDSLLTTKEMLAKTRENVGILKGTQKAKLSVSVSGSNDLHIEKKTKDGTLSTGISRSVEVGLHNIGTVAATNVNMQYGCAVYSYLPPTLEQCKQSKNFFNTNFTIGPTLGDGFSFKVNGQVTEQTYDLYESKKVYLYVAGKITYMDPLSLESLPFCVKLTHWGQPQDCGPLK